MSRPFRHLAILIVWLASVCGSACDVDLFGFDQRKLVGPYCLHVFEGGRYSVDTKESPDGCGVLGGRVLRIGWTDDFILAEQETCGGRGGRSGWVLLNVKSKAVEAIEASAIQKRPELASIKVLEAKAAWESLR